MKKKQSKITHKVAVERRIHRRTPCDFYLRVKVQDIQHPRWDSPLMKNISMGGCYFQSGKIYHTGQCLDLEIQLPTKRYLFRCTGFVKRIEDRWEGTMSYIGVGVIFVDLEPEDKERLIKAIEFIQQEQKDNKE